MPLALQSRKWCFTVFKTDCKISLANKSTDDVTRPRLRYLVFQEEICPDTGTAHLQGYAEFKDPVRKNAFQRWTGDDTCHCEAANGSAAQNKVYCTKEDSRSEGPWEIGEPCKQGKRTDLQGLHDSIREGATAIDLWEDHFPTMVKYHRAVDAYRLAMAPEARDPPVVHVYYGPTGTGKTRRCYHETGGDHFVVDIPAKAGNAAWFDGYDNHAKVLLDDYGGEYSIHFFKRLLDRYPMNCQVKGGYRRWAPTTIYITSNNHPQHWYPEARQVDLDAILRRITNIVHMDTDWSPPDPESPDLVPLPEIGTFPSSDLA